MNYIYLNLLLLISCVVQTMERSVTRNTSEYSYKELAQECCRQQKELEKSYQMLQLITSQANRALNH